MRVQDLLAGICPQQRARLDTSSWASLLWRRCRAYFAVEPGDNPLRDVEQDDARRHYAGLRADKRCARHAARAASRR